MSNTLPLIIFGFLVLLSGRRVFVTALACSWLASGLVRVADRRRQASRSGHPAWSSGCSRSCWCAASINRNWWQILLAVVLFMVYGGILLGVLPTRGRLRLLAGAPGRGGRRSGRRRAAAPPHAPVCGLTVQVATARSWPGHRKRQNAEAPAFPTRRPAVRRQSSGAAVSAGVRRGGDDLHRDSLPFGAV